MLVPKTKGGKGKIQINPPVEVKLGLINTDKNVRAKPTKIKIKPKIKSLGSKLSRTLRSELGCVLTNWVCIQLLHVKLTGSIHDSQTLRPHF